jgi:hypothetical protein
VWTRIDNMVQADKEARTKQLTQQARNRAAARSRSGPAR